jgi:hypothetical protein
VETDSDLEAKVASQVVRLNNGSYQIDLPCIYKLLYTEYTWNWFFLG